MALFNEQIKQLMQRAESTCSNNPMRLPRTAQTTLVYNGNDDDKALRAGQPLCPYIVVTKHVEDNKIEDIEGAKPSELQSLAAYSNQAHNRTDYQVKHQVESLGNGQKLVHYYCMVDIGDVKAQFSNVETNPSFQAIQRYRDSLGFDIYHQNIKRDESGAAMVALLPINVRHSKFSKSATTISSITPDCDPYKFFRYQMKALGFAQEADLSANKNQGVTEVCFKGLKLLSNKFNQTQFYQMLDYILNSKTSENQRQVIYLEPILMADQEKIYNSGVQLTAGINNLPYNTAVKYGSPNIKSAFQALCQQPPGLTDAPDQIEIFLDITLPHLIKYLADFQYANNLKKVEAVRKNFADLHKIKLGEYTDSELEELFFNGDFFMGSPVSSCFFAISNTNRKISLIESCIELLDNFISATINLDTLLEEPTYCAVEIRELYLDTVEPVISKLKLMQYHNELLPKVSNILASFAAGTITSYECCLQLEQLPFYQSCALSNAIREYLFEDIYIFKEEAEQDGLDKAAISVGEQRLRSVGIEKITKLANESILYTAKEISDQQTILNDLTPSFVSGIATIKQNMLTELKQNKSKLEDLKAEYGKYIQETYSFMNAELNDLNTQIDLYKSLSPEINATAAQVKLCDSDIESQIAQVKGYSRGAFNNRLKQWDDYRESQNHKPCAA